MEPLRHDVDTACFSPASRTRAAVFKRALQFRRVLHGGEEAAGGAGGHAVAWRGPPALQVQLAPRTLRLLLRASLPPDSVARLLQLRFFNLRDDGLRLAAVRAALRAAAPADLALAEAAVAAEQDAVGLLASSLSLAAPARFTPSPSRADQAALAWLADPLSADGVVTAETKGSRAGAWTASAFAGAPADAALLARLSDGPLFDHPRKGIAVEGFWRAGAGLNLGNDTPAQLETVMSFHLIRVIRVIAQSKEVSVLIYPYPHISLHLCVFI